MHLDMKQARERPVLLRVGSTCGLLRHHSMLERQCSTSARQAYRDADVDEEVTQTDCL